MPVYSPQNLDPNILASKSSSSFPFFSFKYALILNHFLQISPVCSFSHFILFHLSVSLLSTPHPSLPAFQKKSSFSLTLSPANLFLQLQTLILALSFRYISSVSTPTPPPPTPFFNFPSSLFLIPLNLPFYLPLVQKHSQHLSHIRHGP